MSLDKTKSIHRPGVFKKPHKVHKTGGHRSKNAIRAASKGKVEIKNESRRIKRELNKDQRRQQATHLRKNKRDALVMQRRNLGTAETPPFFVCVLPLSKQLDVVKAFDALSNCDSEGVTKTSPTGILHVHIPRYRQHFAFVTPLLDDEFGVLDTVRITDTTIFMTSALSDEFTDSCGMNLLASPIVLGVSHPIIAVTDLDQIPIKRRIDVKQNILKYFTKYFKDPKVLSLESDTLNLYRAIGNQTYGNKVKDRRGYLYAEAYEYQSESGQTGKLKVTGFLRGNALSVNDLVYLPGLGTFQLSQIDAAKNPYLFIKRSKHIKSNEQQMEDNNHEIRILEKADAAKQEALQSENVPDPMDAEQTWPSEEEIKMAQNETKTLKVKKVPKGWSDYQAAWIPDEDCEELYEDDDEDENASQISENEPVSEEHSSCGEENDDMEVRTIATESDIKVDDRRYDEELDLNMEQEMLEKVKQAKENQIFPDEMDTPQEVSARIRFQKYRGLESFRTSPWDPKENLPSDYGRIYQFQNFERTRKRIIKELPDKEGAMPGWYITVHVANVSEELWNRFLSANPPLILIGMLPHENKISVMNVLLKRMSDSTEPIKSKERLIIQCGYRRFIVNPIFSQHTNGNKHKFERYFQPDSTVVATFYAPIMFGPAPVLCYKESANNEINLIATGSLLSCNPDRLMIKRIVLSGHPFKLFKRSAVIRFMFFNREDIIYFKPCRLRTKYGRSGHIKEAIGTHGHMKCIFDGQLKSQDTVLLNLYKRVFPKWTYEECTVCCPDSIKCDVMET